MASSKLNGQSDTGLAFGICPPMASGVEHSSIHTSSEHALPVAYSAVCYHGREDVRILPVVMTEGELCQVQRQIRLADIVIGADHAPLQQAPEAVEVRRVDAPAHILALGVVHGLVRKFTLQSGVSRVFIGRDQGHVFTDGLPNEAAQGYTVRILNDLADHITLASNCADHTDLVAAWASLQALLVPVPVLILTADIGFVYFHFAHKLGKASVLHRGSDPVAHIPGRFIGPAADLALNLQSTDALLALGHEVNDLEPDAKVIVGILKDGLGNDREPIAVPSTAVFALADPMKWLGLQFIDLLVVATRATHAIRPAAFLQEFFAGFFGREPLHQLGERLSRLGRHGLTSIQMSGV